MFSIELEGQKSTYDFWFLAQISIMRLFYWKDAQQLHFTISVRIQELNFCFGAMGFDEFLVVSEGNDFANRGRSQVALDCHCSSEWRDR